MNQKEARKLAMKEIDKAINTLANIPWEITSLLDVQHQEDIAMAHNTLGCAYQDMKTSTERKVS